MMNEFGKAAERIEGLLKADCNRNSNPTLLNNLRAVYDTYAADPAQKKEAMRVSRASL